MPISRFDTNLFDSDVLASRGGSWYETRSLLSRRLFLALISSDRGLVHNLQQAPSSLRCQSPPSVLHTSLSHASLSGAAYRCI